MKRLILFLSILAIAPNKNIEYCEIKGNVNKPGVYEIKNNYTIQDIIKASGGLKKNSYTNNINLSKKVTDEMVIYINTKKEIDNIKKLSNCNCTPIYKYIECEETKEKQIPKPEIETTTKLIPTTTTTKLIKTTTTITSTTPVVENIIININTATKEELMTINGIGESKAINIIKYREENGDFKNIEEIINVSGIGQTIFEKIKEFIKV